MKIRRPNQAPVKIECEYNGNPTSGLPFANMLPKDFHCDKTINIDEMAKTFNNMSEKFSTEAQK